MQPEDNIDTRKLLQHLEAFKLELKSEIAQGLIYASGTLASENTATTYKNMVETHNLGITKTNNSTYTVLTPGVYFIRFQQLIQTGGSAMNFGIRVNNVEVRKAWQNSSDMQDLLVADIRYLFKGDTIRIYQDSAITNSWAGTHSGYQIFMVNTR